MMSAGPIEGTDPERVHDRFIAQIEPLRAALLDFVAHVEASRHTLPHRAEPGSPGAREEEAEPPFAAALGGHPAIEARQVGLVQLGAAEDTGYGLDILRDLAFLALSGLLVWRPRTKYSLDGILLGER